MKWVCAALAAGFLSAISVTMTGDAYAQIDTGIFAIVQVDGEVYRNHELYPDEASLPSELDIYPDEAPLADDLELYPEEDCDIYGEVHRERWTMVGVIIVPKRGAGRLSYEEEWIFFDDYELSELPSGAVVQIVPLTIDPQAARGVIEIARAVGRRVQASASEYHLLREDATSAGALNLLGGRNVEPDKCSVTEIIQCAECDAEFESRDWVRVGVIRSFQEVERDLANQEWLLSSGYVYPSPSNGVITRLQPLAIPCSEAPALLTAPPEKAIQVHQTYGYALHNESDIAIDDSMSTSLEEAVPGCRIKIVPSDGASKGYPIGAFLCIGLGFVAWCRRLSRMS